MKKVYDSNSRGEFIEQIKSGEKRMSEAAEELGVKENTFYEWQKRLRDNSDRGSSRRAQKARRASKHG